MQGEMLVKEWDICITDIINCHEDITLSYKWKRPHRNTGDTCYLMLGLEGATTFATRKGTYSIGKADILFLPEGLEYIGSCTEVPARCTMIRFKIAGKTGFDAPFLLSPNRIDRYQELFLEMRSKFLIGEYGSKTELKALLYKLLHRIVRDLLMEDAAELGYRRIKAAILYIHENYACADLHIAHAAAASNMSEVHFRRVFKDVFGTSPLAYVTQLRMKKAKELLAHTDYPVGSIAGMVGICDEVYFSKFFRKHTGQTPNQFRKSQL